VLPPATPMRARIAAFSRPGNPELDQTFTLEWIGAGKHGAQMPGRGVGPKLLCSAAHRQTFEEKRLPRDLQTLDAKHFIESASGRGFFAVGGGRLGAAPVRRRSRSVIGQKGPTVERFREKRNGSNR